MQFLDTLNSLIAKTENEQKEDDIKLQKIRGVQVDNQTGLPIHSVETVKPIPLS